MGVQAVPEEYQRLAVTLCVDDGVGAIDLYRALFGAETQLVLTTGDGRLRHAQLRVGDSLILITDEFPEHGTLSPRSTGGSPVTMLIYVEDVDDVFDRALAAGCQPLKAVRDEFYGDRTGKFVDPYGHRWSVATHIEDVSLDEISRRASQS